MGVQAIKHAVMLQEWSTKIAECRSSGMSVKDWCAEQGITIKTYYYWEKRLRKSYHFLQNDHVNELLSCLEYRMIIMIREKVLQRMMPDKSTAFIKRNC